MIEYFKEGSGIHIKPENRGKFTEYKKRTGKTTEECLHSKNAHVRQMANFARNAAHWSHKHEEGAKLISRNKSDNITSFKGIATGNEFTVEKEYKQKNKLKLKHLIGGIVKFLNPSGPFPKITEPADNTRYENPHQQYRYGPPATDNRTFLEKVDDFVDDVELINDGINLASGISTVVYPNPYTAALYGGTSFLGSSIDGWQALRSLLKGNYKDSAINAGEMVLGVIGGRAASRFIKPKTIGISKVKYNGVPIDVVQNLTARALPASVANTGIDIYSHTNDDDQ